MAKECKWILKEPADPAKVERLSTEVGIDKVLAELLVKRGVETFEQARSFFRPSLDALHDPFLMKDMAKAVERLHSAIAGGEKILVYGDYDVDGTTAVALVYSFIKRFTDQVDFYIPDRYDEGYGVSYKGIDWAADGGFKLIITLDCGIKAIDKVDYARSKGLEVIICDHHLPEESLPDAVAVLDPKRADCTYPFDDLSGCGVGFKLAQAYSPMTVRFFILQAHYRGTLDFSNEALQAAEKGYKRLMAAWRALGDAPERVSSPSTEVAAIIEAVEEALCDDMNTPIAIAHLFEAVKLINGGKLAPADASALKVLFDQVVGGVLGLRDEEAGASGKAQKALEGVMGLVLEARKKAREEKNWAESDRIRDTLASFGITVKDTKEGATWTLE